MNINPTVFHGRPGDKRTPTEEAIYQKLDELGIEYDRVDHDHADTMEDCRAIETLLGGKICKNLFLCNRQATEFYLLMMPGEKVFKTKNITAPLGCSRLSFAGAEHMAQLLHTVPGSVSGMELLFDTEHRVRLVLDRELLNDDTICGHPGLSVSTLKIRRDEMLRYFDAIDHHPTVIDLLNEE